MVGARPQWRVRSFLHFFVSLFYFFSGICLLFPPSASLSLLLVRHILACYYRWKIQEGDGGIDTRSASLGLAWAFEGALLLTTCPGRPSRSASEGSQGGGSLLSPRLLNTAFNKASFCLVIFSLPYGPPSLPSSPFPLDGVFLSQQSAQQRRRKRRGLRLAATGCAGKSRRRKGKQGRVFARLLAYALSRIEASCLPQNAHASPCKLQAQIIATSVTSSPRHCHRHRFHNHHCRH